jgi:integrase
MGKLTATAVKAKIKPGRYGDGEGLALLVGPTGSKSWIVRVQKDGKRRDIGLGSALKVPLKLARERAADVRSQLEAGLDPVAERRKATGVPTFRAAAALVHAEHVAGWKGGKDSKHGAQWLATLNSYAFPAFGDATVNGVTEAAVRDVLATIWLTKPETARRLRQRIRTVMDWAVAKGYREASLTMSKIDKALPKQRDVAKHHAALDYAVAPEFMAELRNRETVGRLALEALILTAVRCGDIRGMKWSEIDLAGKLWSIPTEEVGRGKGGRVHVVPLSNAVLDVLERAKKHKRGDTDLVFPGAVKGKQQSDNTLRKVAIDMGYPITAHGFRSTFADWVNEQTSFTGEVREAALAHKRRDKVEAAYSRTDYLEKRRPLMEAWANYCLGGESGNVIRLAV